MTSSAILCINLIDEAERKGIHIDIDRLSQILGIPIIATNARDEIGLDTLQHAIYDMTTENSKINPHQIKYDNRIEEIIKT